MEKNYEVDLYYGYEESTYGISLEFEVVDPAVPVDSDKIGDQLAEGLDVDFEEASKNGSFNWNSCSVKLPDSLVARIQEDAIKDYLAKGTFEKNSKIVYGSADASNNKAWNEAVIRGVLTAEQKQVILGCLNEGEFFIPGAVGLEIELPWEYDPQEDHPFWRLYEDSFEETTRKPTVDVTAEEFVAAFVENKEKWEELGVEYIAEFKDDFEGDSVEDIIVKAEFEAKANSGQETEIEPEFGI